MIDAIMTNNRDKYLKMFDVLNIKLSQPELGLTEKEIYINFNEKIFTIS